MVNVGLGVLVLVGLGAVEAGYRRERAGYKRGKERYTREFFLRGSVNGTKYT